MTPSWVGVATCSRVGRLCRGSGQTGLMGPALGSQQPHTALQAWGGVAGKLPGGKGPWGVG